MTNGTTFRSIAVTVLLTVAATIVNAGVSISADNPKIDNRNKGVTFAITGLETRSNVCLNISDAEGSRVAQLVATCDDQNVWSATWSAKSDMGEDVVNGRYVVSLQVGGVPEDAPRVEVLVDRSQVISNLTVSPNPFWPTDITKGRTETERKAVISFVLTRTAKLVIRIQGPKAEGEVYRTELPERSPGQISLAWDGRNIRTGKNVGTEGEYAVAVTAIDPDDEANLVTESSPLTLKKVPWIYDLSCVPATFSPDGDGINDVTTIGFKVGVPDDREKRVIVGVSIFNETGDRVATLTPGSAVAVDAPQRVVWDGRHGQNNLRLITAEPVARRKTGREADEDESEPEREVGPTLPNGRYLVRIHAVDGHMAEASPQIAKVEIENFVPIKIDLAIATKEQVAATLADASSRETRFWASPDAEIEHVEWQFRGTRGAALTVAPSADPNRLPDTVAPYALILPMQEYVPWLRFRVNKRASVTFQVYSLKGGTIGSITLDDAVAGLPMRVSLKEDGGSLADKLKNGATYRGTLLATDFESPITVKSEFLFSVYKATPPTVPGLSEWHAVSQTDSTGRAGDLRIGRTVTFPVEVHHDSVVALRVFKTEDDRDAGRQPVIEVKMASKANGRADLSWSPGEGGKTIPEGRYCYTISALRIDEEAVRAAEDMPGLEMEAGVSGDRLWILALPEISMVVKPTGQPAVIHPDGISDDQNLSVLWSSSVRKHYANAAVTLHGLLKNDSAVEVARLDGSGLSTSGRWNWGGALTDGTKAADGRYVIEWVAGCNRERDELDTSGVRDVAIALDVPQTHVQVDRLPRVDGLTVRPGIFSPDADGVADSTEINCVIGDASRVSVTVSGNNTTRELYDKSDCLAGPFQLTWDGCDSDGKYVGHGDYKVSISTEDAQGNSDRAYEKIEALSYYWNLNKEMNALASEFLRVGQDAERIQLRRSK